MKKIIVSFVLSLTVQFGFAQDAAFKADVAKYLDVSGASVTIRMITDKLVDSVSEDKKADFKKELDTSAEDLMSKMADVYMTEFTHDDIKEILKFYETPVGKKLGEKTEVLTEKAQKIGEEWGIGLQSVLVKYMQ